MDTASDVDILLIEDNPRDAELTIRALRNRNLVNSLEWVKDGAAGLAFVFGADTDPPGPVCRRPKVVLLDLKLPKVDGLDVLRILKSHETAKAIPVVVLSSSREEQDVIRSYELGVNSYIVKPVDFDNFSEAVAQLGLYWLLLNQRPDRPGDTR
jgi:two-component system, response regulator